MMNGQTARGVLMALGTALAWGGTGSFAKLIAAGGVSQLTVVCYRGFFAASVVGLFMLARRGSSFFRCTRAELAQYAALEALVQDLRRELPLRFVTGHEHIAPERKADPGPFFDWERVRRFLPEGMEIAIRPEDCCREMLAERMRSLAAGRG